MDVDINFRLTEELQQRILRDYFRAVFLREHFLAFVVLCLMLAITLVAYFVDGSATPALIVGFIFVAGIAAWTVAYSSAVKAGKAELCLRGQGQHHLIVSERGITFHDDRGETTILWTDVDNRFETKQIIALRVNREPVSILPKELLPVEVCDYIRSKVPDVEKKRKSSPQPK